MVAPAIKKAGPLIDSAIDAGSRKVRGEGAGAAVSGIAAAAASTFFCTKCRTPIPIQGEPDQLVCPNPKCRQVYKKEPPVGA